MARNSTQRSSTSFSPRGAAQVEGEIISSETFGRVVLFAQMFVVGLITLAMTPKTNNLDDIKQALLLIFGPMLGTLGLAALALGQAPGPNRVIGGGMIAYFITLFISAAASKHPWAAREFILFTWAAYGLFLGGVAVGSRATTAFRYLVFSVGLAALVNLLGFFQYDISGSGKTGTVWLYNALYGGVVATNTPTALQQILYTFNADARSSLMSTILNRDFFAAFCLLYMPLALALGLMAERWLTRALGLVTALLCVVSVALAKSKGEYIFGAAELILFAALFALRGRQAGKAVKSVLPWIAGAATLLAAILLLNAPTLLQQLKSFSFSVSSRQIIFSGALKIFAAHPILGGGPGTFKLLFPLHRSDNYFEHEISNVTELAHNYILDILSETGLLGAITFAVFALPLAALAFREIFRAPRENEDPRPRLYLIATLCGLFGLYGSNMTSTSGRWPIGIVGLWSILGLMMGLIRQMRGWTPASRVAPAWADNTGDASKAWFKNGITAVVILSAVTNFYMIAQGRRFWIAQKDYSRAVIQHERANRAIAGLRAQRVTPNAEQKKPLIATLTEAGDLFDRATKRYPWHLSAYYKCGSVENMLADLDTAHHEDHIRSAASRYETLIRYAPDYAEVSYNLGIVYYRLSQIETEKLVKGRAAGTLSAEDEAGAEAEIRELQEKSLASYERMGGMSRKSEVLYNLGYAYFQSDRLDLAMTTYEKAMGLYPDDPDFPSFLLRAASAAKDPARQIKALKALYLHYPIDRLQGPEAGLLQQLGLIKPQGRASHLLAGLEIASANGLKDEFEELVRLGLERNPVDPMIHAQVAIWAEKQQDWPRALEAARTYQKLMGMKEIAEMKPDANGDRVMRIGATAAERLGNAAAVEAVK